MEEEESKWETPRGDVAAASKADETEEAKGDRNGMVADVRQDLA